MRFGTGGGTLAPPAPAGPLALLVDDDDDDDEEEDDDDDDQYVSVVSSDGDRIFGGRPLPRFATAVDPSAPDAAADALAAIEGGLALLAIKGASGVTRTI